MGLAVQGVLLAVIGRLADVQMEGLMLQAQAASNAAFKTALQNQLLDLESDSIIDDPANSKSQYYYFVSRGTNPNTGETYEIDSRDQTDPHFNSTDTKNGKNYVDLNTSNYKRGIGAVRSGPGTVTNNNEFKGTAVRNSAPTYTKSTDGKGSGYVVQLNLVDPLNLYKKVEKEVPAKDKDGKEIPGEYVTDITYEQNDDPNANINELYGDDKGSPISDMFEGEGDFYSINDFIGATRVSVNDDGKITYLGAITTGCVNIYMEGDTLSNYPGAYKVNCQSGESSDRLQKALANGELYVLADDNRGCHKATESDLADPSKVFVIKDNTGNIYKDLDDDSKGAKVNGYSTMTLAQLATEDALAYEEILTALENSYGVDISDQKALAAFAVIPMTDDTGKTTYGFVKTSELDGKRQVSIMTAQDTDIRYGTGSVGATNLQFNSQGGLVQAELEDGTVITFTTERMFDQDRYDADLQEYNNQKADTDKQKNELNKQLNQLAADDKYIEQQLTVLNTEMQALQTQIDSIKQILKDNIQRIFKTFGG